MYKPQKFSEWHELYLNMVNLLQLLYRHTCLLAHTYDITIWIRSPTVFGIRFFPLYTLLHCRILVRNASSSCHMIGQCSPRIVDRLPKCNCIKKASMHTKCANCQLSKSYEFLEQ